jgi:hypothetical protein
MTGTVPGTWPPRDLPARLFRALYRDFDLRTPGGLHVAVPKGTLWYSSGHSLGDLALQIAAAPPPRPPGASDLPGRAGQQQAARLLPPGSAGRLTYILHAHPQWSVFWDKRYHLWRTAEDDPDSALYAEHPDPDTIISYITSRT